MLSHMSLDSGVVTISSTSSAPVISRGGPIKATIRPKALTENSKASPKTMLNGKPHVLVAQSHQQFQVIRGQTAYMNVVVTIPVLTVATGDHYRSALIPRGAIHILLLRIGHW